MRKQLAHGLAVVLSIVSLGAAQKPNSSGSEHARSNVTRNAKQAGKKAYQVGVASWYGEYFDGKPTASGEPYDMYDMTAAHLTLPLGSYVRVTNLRNGRAVVVRVNDRGPIVAGRIIDLSYGAATALGYDKRGLQKVRLDLVKPIQRKPVYQTVAVNQ